MVAVLLVDVGFGDLHSTKDPAMDLYIIQMSKLILQSADIFKHQRNRYFFVFIAILLIFVGSNNALQKISKASNDENKESMSIVIQQIGRSLKNDKIKSEYSDVLYKIILPENIKKYNEAISDPIKENFNMRFTDKNAWKIYLKNGLDHPDTYADAFLYTCKGLWDINDQSYNHINGKNDGTFGYLVVNSFEKKYQYSFFPKLKGIFSWLFSFEHYYNIPIFKFLFTPAVYLFFYLLMLHFISSNAIIKKSISLLLFYYLTLFAGPCVLVRYVFPLMICMPFLFLISINEKNSRYGEL